MFLINPSYTSYFRLFSKIINKQEEVLGCRLQGMNQILTKISLYLSPPTQKEEGQSATFGKSEHALQNYNKDLFASSDYMQFCNSGWHCSGSPFRQSSVNDNRGLSLFLSLFKRTCQVRDVGTETGYNITVKCCWSLKQAKSRKNGPKWPI